jgi:mannose/fructose/N-acetylgalactosamine-specific phosphotransferase system component IIB
VLTEVLCNLVPPSVAISVHSRRNAASISSWIAADPLRKRIQVSSSWPQLSSAQSSAVIVVNAAGEHEAAVEHVLAAGVPVLVEKPITLKTVNSQRLADMARISHTRFAAAHVFLFARYLENFRQTVGDTRDIEAVRVLWMDPRFENRHGERKQFDPGVPVFADCLPHVSSIIGALAPGLPQTCGGLKFFRGGAHLELDILLGAIPCSVQLVRNGERRQRIVEVSAQQGMRQLDFSSEPGRITCGSTVLNADPDWQAGMRPAALMLATFLQWAAGGQFDRRLDVEIGLQASRLIEEAWALYNPARAAWLAGRLADRAELDDDLRYALGEAPQDGSAMAALVDVKQR